MQVQRELVWHAGRLLVLLQPLVVSQPVLAVLTPRHQPLPRFADHLACVCAHTGIAARLAAIGGAILGAVKPD